MFNRYDYFKAEVELVAIYIQKYITGISYYFIATREFLLGFNHIDYEDGIKESDYVKRG